MVTADAPLVLFAPELGRALEQGALALEALAMVDPSIGKMLAASAPFDPRGLLTRRGLFQAGIDPSAPLTVIPNAHAGVVVLRFGLRDRPAFEAWLDRVGERERPRVQIGAETASVLAPDTDRPLTCIVRHTQALCQVGASEGDNAVADLARAAAASGATYARLAGVVDAYRELPAGAVLYLFANPAPLARDAAHLHGIRERRSSRFAEPQARAQIEDGLKQTVARLHRWAGWIDGAAAAVVVDGRIQMQVELTASRIGRRWLADALPDRTTDDAIGRWTETPALFSALVHADPEFVQRAASSFGFELPKDVLSGTIGLLGLGVDPECPSAKRSTAEGLGWAFLIPSALNIGIVDKARADRVHAMLEQRFKPALSPYEIHVLDRMMVVGTGVGSGPAALRRLASIKPSAEPPSRAPFFRAAIYPRAVDAAFAAGAIGREHRRELLTVEALRLQLKPLLERIDAIDLEAHASGDHQRVSVEVQVR
jgi:hypothetical protein